MSRRIRQLKPLEYRADIRDRRSARHAKIVGGAGDPLTVGLDDRAERRGEGSVGGSSMKPARLRVRCDGSGPRPWCVGVLAMISLCWCCEAPASLVAREQDERCGDERAADARRPGPARGGSRQDESTARASRMSPSDGLRRIRPRARTAGRRTARARARDRRGRADAAAHRRSTWSTPSARSCCRPAFWRSASWSPRRRAPGTRPRSAG